MWSALSLICPAFTANFAWEEIHINVSLLDTSIRKIYKE
jgi:hypothetical protein